jgi:nucleotide-binding universal stress UspA family protein
MAVILCATRGGEESACTQEEAIRLAKERGDTLLFLYVVNLHFLDKTAAPIVVDVEDEISDLGDFLLLVAKERAAEQGVEARTIQRKGIVREEIMKTALEEDVSLVVLGCPTGEKSAFLLADLEKFATAIEAETGAKTEIVRKPDN